MMKYIKNIQKILFLNMLGLFIVCTVFAAEDQSAEDATDQSEESDQSDDTSSEGEEVAEDTTAEETDPMKLPDAWLRLINIMQKGLEVCNLEGNDFKVFGDDINLVTQSPFNKRAPLEKIRFNQVLKSARQHKAFINQASQQTKIIKIQNIIQKQITLNDYMEATEFLLNKFDDINDKRNKEILSYFAYMVSYDPLSDDNKGDIEALLKNAMDKMPGDQEQLQQYLNLLRRQPQIITKVVKVNDGQMKSIRLTGTSGASSRGLGNQVAHIETHSEAAAAREQQRQDRAQQIAERSADAARRRAAAKGQNLN